MEVRYQIVYALIKYRWHVDLHFPTKIIVLSKCALQAKADSVDAVMISVRPQITITILPPTGDRGRGVVCSNSDNDGDAAQISATGMGVGRTIANGRLKMSFRIRR